MNKNRTPHIAIITGTYIESIKDLTSGFLRYKAETKPLWNIKIFTSYEMQTAGDWRQNVIEWRPDGIAVASMKARYYLSGQSSAISCRCKIAAFASDDPALDKQMPPRTIFVDINDADIVEAAFNLMKKRGLESFAFVHTAEASEVLRSSRRAAALRRMADKAGFTFTECGACRDDNWTSRLTSLADELAALPTPCGVMAYNDRCAREVIDACNLAGLSIPSQIQVVGVDDQQEICENVRPRLTSIEPDFEGVGYLLAQRMDELLTTGKAKKMSICGVKRIVERETTRDLSGAARLVTAAEKYINANACQGLPPSPKGLVPSALAAALKVSRRYLEIRFKEVKGEGIAEAIRRRKLEEVCRLLRETDLPIGEIAYRCGFPVQTHLNAIFRRTYGTTLRTYRQSDGPIPARSSYGQNTAESHAHKRNGGIRP